MRLDTSLTGTRHYCDGNHHRGPSITILCLGHCFNRNYNTLSCIMDRPIMLNIRMKITSLHLHYLQHNIGLMGFHLCM